MIVVAYRWIELWLQGLVVGRFTIKAQTSRQTKHNAAYEAFSDDLAKVMG